MHHKKVDCPKSIYTHRSNCNNTNCNVQCTKLNTCKEAKYLGFTIDSKWAYKNHIENLIKRLRQMMPSLYRLKGILNTKIKRNLYFAWVESILRYGIEIYGQATESQLDRVQKTQNKIIKILFKEKDNASTEEIFTKNNILKIRQLRNSVIIYNNYFSPNFKQVSQHKSERFRPSTYKYNVPFAPNEYGKRIRNVVIPNLFNKLPNKMFNINSISRLKKELKLYLLDTQRGDGGWEWI